MFDGYDVSDLLALIEQELDPKKAAALRRRLADDPAALAAIDRMREDREHLRAIEEPVVPLGMLTEIEPMLARPMLMPQEGDWRRRYRRRRAWPIYAAAVITLAALAGVWATLWVNWTGDSPRGEQMAERRPAPGPGPVTDTPETATEEPWPPAGTLVHHHGPTSLDGTGTADGSRAKRTMPDKPVMEAAQLVLLVKSNDTAGVEQTLQRVLNDLDAEAALVRNFSFQEAQQIAHRLRLNGRGGTDGQEPILSGVGTVSGRSAQRDSNRRSQDAIRRLARQLEQAGDDDLVASAHLWGASKLAPSYAKQLEFSDQGAVYTISIPASRLAAMLERLDLVEGQLTALQSWPPEAQHSALRWLRDYPQLRNAADQLGAANQDAVIYLPVVVR